MENIKFIVIYDTEKKCHIWQIGAKEHLIDQNCYILID